MNNNEEREKREEERTEIDRLFIRGLKRIEKNYRITETLRFIKRFVCIEIEENFKRKSCEKKHDN